MKNILYRPSEDLIVHVLPSGKTNRYTPHPQKPGWWLTNDEEIYDETHLLMGISDMAIGSAEVLNEEMELIHLAP